MFRNPWFIFSALAIILAILFFTLPINLFDGVIVFKSGLQEINIERPLSLSYFIGLGFEEGDMVGVENFYLTLKGKVMALIFILGLPALLAYRFHLKK